MIDIRGEDGRWLGIFDGRAEPSYRAFRVPIHVPPTLTFNASPSIRPVSCEIIDFKWAEWCDRDRCTWVLLASDRDVDRLDKVRRVFVKGQTSVTWWGQRLLMMEALIRLIGYCRFATLNRGTIH